MTQKDRDTLVDKYLAAWNEYDPVARQNLLQIMWHVDGVYIDPMTTSKNRPGYL